MRRAGSAARGLLAAAAAATAALCAPAPAARADEPELVQCLLPSAARRLGPIVYLPPRRIVAVASGDCSRLEGEIVDPARALAIGEAQLPLRPAGEAAP